MHCNTGESKVFAFITILAVKSGYQYLFLIIQNVVNMGITQTLEEKHSEEFSS